MSLHKAVHDAVFLVYTGDSGAGGLANTSASCYVRVWDRVGQPTQLQNWPYVLSEVVGDDPADAFSSSKPGSRVVLRLHVFCDRDQTRQDGAYLGLSGVDMDAVCARLRLKFLQTTLTDAGGVWLFTPCSRCKRMRAPYTEKELHEVIQFEMESSQ